MRVFTFCSEMVWTWILIWERLCLLSIALYFVSIKVVYLRHVLNVKMTVLCMFHDKLCWHSYVVLQCCSLCMRIPFGQLDIINKTMHPGQSPQVIADTILPPGVSWRIWYFCYKLRTCSTKKTPHHISEIDMGYLNLRWWKNTYYHINDEVKCIKNAFHF